MANGINSGIRPRRLSAVTTAPAVRERQSGTVRTLATPDTTHRRWRIAEGNKAPGEADRLGLSSRLHSAVIVMAGVKRSRRSWAIAMAYGRALEVALGVVVVTGEGHVRLVSSSVAIPIGRERQMRGTRHDGLDERGDQSQ